MKPRKQCSVEGCSWPLFARGYCKSHYNILYLLPKQKEKNTIQKPIKRRTEKRSKQEKTYTVLREVFIASESIKDLNGRIFCIFCGRQIKGEPSLHHGEGRDDEMLLDVHYWFLSHNECHVHQYHSMSWTRLVWWHDYLERIRQRCPELYKKELKRMEK